jgi:8-oxo-dGTP pyrophosphatase MutT (NUDIX family)
MNTNDKLQVMAEGKFLRLVAQSGWEWVERVNASGAAVIAAVTDDDKLILVEQYRIPMHSRVVDLPAGLVGDDPGTDGEAMIDAARRELFEETGLDAGDAELRPLGVFPYRRDKDLALFAWTPPLLPDPQTLVCTSYFSWKGAMLPEFDRFGLFTSDQALARVGKGLARLLAGISLAALCDASD